MESTREQQGAAPGQTLLRFYSALLESFGPQGWWPARTRWEVICGAILTQNTTWRNATLALENLRKAGALNGQALRRLASNDLEELIRPAGFYRQKARALQGIANWLDEVHGGSLDALFAVDPLEARNALLALTGIGPETADAILLYAGQHPTFVADAYTRRVLSRHGLIPAAATYGVAREFLHHHLAPDHGVFNEFHALLVETAKRHCQRNAAHCEECPLGSHIEEIRNSKVGTR